MVELLGRLELDRLEQRFGVRRFVVGQRRFGERSLGRLVRWSDVRRHC